MLMLLLLACGRKVDGSPGEPADYPELLAKSVHADGTVDYELLEAGQDTLRAYVHELGVAQPLQGEAALAQGINAYNAFVLLGVVDREIQTSVQELSVGLLPSGGAGFFVGLKFLYQGERTSLSSFENKALRQGFQDPRLHAAINCASAGCPPLSPTLYTAADLDSQLDHAMSRFVAERSSPGPDSATFSQIFEWFSADFLDWGSAKSLCEYAARYAPAAQAAEYQRLDLAGCPHTFEPYDWSLNGTR